MTTPAKPITGPQYPSRDEMLARYKAAIAGTPREAQNWAAAQTIGIGYLHHFMILAEAAVASRKAQEENQ